MVKLKIKRKFKKIHTREVLGKFAHIKLIFEFFF